MNPLLTEVMNNRVVAMVEEAATVAYRTAYTTFVKQTQDFQVALARLSGNFFAYPVTVGVTPGVGYSIQRLLEHFAFEDLQPGDVLISNDPFRTGGLVTPMMDIHLVCPIFVGGKLVCFAWSFVHASDIGGAVPGSISPDLTECFQEGIRLRPTKLVRAGTLNSDILNVLLDNSRIGDAVWGDLEALMAAMHLLDQRVGELCGKVGIDTFHVGVDSVMTYAEHKAREVIARLEDGTYTSSDYLEGDGPDDAIHIHCSLTVNGDEAEIDYAGSSPQVQAALNFTTRTRSHPFLCLGLTNYIQTVEPTIPINGGIIRPITTKAPLGTIMNAEFPAAMGNRWVTSMRIYDALMGCLNQAIPGGPAACGAAQAGVISVAWTEPESGRNCVAVVEPFSSGSGGRCQADGVDATDSMLGYLKSTPIERVEVETSLVVCCHKFVPDRIGHGRHRGGAAVCIELECRAPGVKIMVHGLERFRFQPWGVFGGWPGHNGRTVVNSDSETQEIRAITVLTLGKGDLLHMVSPSGGGFGDPILREPDLVLRDVLDETITPVEVASIYKVVVADRRVDEAGTKAARAEATSRSDPIAHGPERQRYGAVGR
ncbi:MAG TPA: hydantoinase B/oxoprolinase family protein [Microvirga sp.]|jgi:N-methylhydantoinase B|nr:hydantoinase B/oxoprolinase family protein [Microvirga sp.]